MIRVYFLPVETIDTTEQVKGSAWIHDALLECTEDPAERKLIMDTAADEDTWLSSLATEAYDASQEEIDLYNAQVTLYVLNLGIVRAQELLGTSPDAITMPQIWELLRIFARLLGILK